MREEKLQDELPQDREVLRRGENLGVVDLTGRGLVGDRAYALVDPDTDKVMSGKTPWLTPITIWDRRRRRRWALTVRHCSAAGSS